MQAQARVVMSVWKSFLEAAESQQLSQQSAALHRSFTEIIWYFIEQALHNEEAWFLVSKLCLNGESAEQSPGLWSEHACLTFSSPHRVLGLVWRFLCPSNVLHVLHVITAFCQHGMRVPISQAGTWMDGLVCNPEWLYARIDWLMNEALATVPST